MPRARNIKPGFFKNEILAELPVETRLLFIGLWTMADRDGRLEDRPKRIKMEVFPADSVDVDEALEALHSAGFIERYGASTVQVRCKNQRQYIQILNFAKHQNPHKNERESDIPTREELDAQSELAPEQHSTNRADSLIPDSLIPDSLKKHSAPNGARALAKPEYLDASVWNDYRSFRTSKKAKLTATAWQRIDAQLQQGINEGHDPNEMLAEAMEAGWTGFKFEWYANRINGGGNKPTEDPRERAVREALEMRAKQLRAAQ